MARSPWAVPIGRVIEGMGVIDDLYFVYRDTPDPAKIWDDGKEYLDRSFPKMSYITSCKVLLKTPPRLRRLHDLPIKKPIHPYTDAIIMSAIAFSLVFMYLTVTIKVKAEPTKLAKGHTQ